MQFSKVVPEDTHKIRNALTLSFLMETVPAMVDKELSAAISYLRMGPPV